MGFMCSSDVQPDKIINHCPAEPSFIQAQDRLLMKHQNHNYMYLPLTDL